MVKWVNWNCFLVFFIYLKTFKFNITSSSSVLNYVEVTANFHLLEKHKMKKNYDIISLL